MNKNNIFYILTIIINTLMLAVEYMEDKVIMVDMVFMEDILVDKDIWFLLFQPYLKIWIFDSFLNYMY